MLKWNDVLVFASKGNPTPPKRVEKSDEEWKKSSHPINMRSQEKKEPSAPLQVNIVRHMILAFMHAGAAEHCFSIQV